MSLKINKKIQNPDASAFINSPQHDTPKDIDMSKTATHTHRAVLISELAKIPLFSKLEPHALKNVSEVCQVFTFNKNEVLYTSGMPLHGIYIVLSGNIYLYHESLTGNKNLISASLNHGECFGLSSLAPEKIALTSCKALGTSKIIFILSENFRSLFAQYPILQTELFHIYYKQQYWLLTHAIYMQANSIESRLAHWIARQPTMGTSAPSHNSVKIPTTKTDLARQLGVKVETLSRAFAVMKVAGAIAIKGRIIFILNRKLLESYMKE